MTQQPLIGRPGHRRNLWARVLDGYDTVVDAAWRDAITASQYVGTCGHLGTSGLTCGQPLRPGEPYEVGALTWYPAACAAGHESSAHGPRPEKTKKGAA